MELTFVFFSVCIYFGCQLQCKGSQALSPPNITLHPHSVTNYTGSNVIFQCRAHGDPPPDISWFKNGSIINLQAASKKEGNYTVLSTLRLVNITVHDEGNYSCFANNSQGNSTSTQAEMRINDTYSQAEPGTVTAVYITINPTPLVVTTTSQANTVAGTSSLNRHASTELGSTVTSTSGAKQFSISGTFSATETGTTDSGSAVNPTMSSDAVNLATSGLKGSTASSSGLEGRTASISGIEASTASSSGLGGSTASINGSLDVSTPDAGPSVKNTKVDLQLTMNLTYEKGYSDTSSEDFKKLKNLVNGALFPVMRKEISGFVENGSGLVSASEGSVIANIAILVNLQKYNISGNVNTSIDSAIESAVLKANKSKELDVLKLVEIQATVTPDIVSTSAPLNPGAPGDDDDGLEGWEIALIVICVLILIGIVTFVVFLLFNNKKSVDTAKELEEIRQEDHQYAQVNENVYDNPDTGHPVHEDRV